MALALAAGSFVSTLRGQPVTNTVTNSGTPQTVVAPAGLRDPIEPFNRAMWTFNRGLMNDIILPTARVYRAIIRKPIRTGFANMGRNLNYPDRVINNLLQGRWRGARDETYRFLCNSTAGLAGIFDVASNKFNVQQSDADFGQTFGKWGWRPDFFLMLPLFGPSNDRDTVGLAGDTASNPLLYISPYNFKENDPFTWLGPYSYFTYAVMYNDMSDSVEDYVRFAKAEMDPYAEIEYAWTFARETRRPDFHIKGPPDPAALQTLSSAFLTTKDPNFLSHSKTRSVLIPTTGRRLRFTYWMQPKPAPILYLVPGLGSHRLVETSLALGEVFYRAGFSVVTISSPFNFEFMENASTADLPAYLPVDGHDLHVALTAIDRRLATAYRNRITARALMGYSMGAVDTLYIASTAATNSLLKFDRYLAVDTPVRLLHGVSELDDFYNAPLVWPARERNRDMNNTLLKMAAVEKNPRGFTNGLPFDGAEAKFLIGLSFRFTLRDIIFTSQRLHSEKILRHEIRDDRRAQLYNEIMRYSYQDYFEKFAVPYYQTHGLASASTALDHGGDMHNYEAGLKANPRVRVIVNHNDFLLAPEDLDWLRATFGPNHLTVFPEGGHLGNFGQPEVQKAMYDALADLKGD
jgi:ABC-type transporter lipoprotein component MlaA/pimeloyl-ACP methyl ester carboxylesterase